MKTFSNFSRGSFQLLTPPALTVSGTPFCGQQPQLVRIEWKMSNLTPNGILEYLPWLFYSAPDRCKNLSMWKKRRDSRIQTWKGWQLRYEPSNIHRKPEAVLLSEERKKKKKYLEACLD